VREELLPCALGVMPFAYAGLMAVFLAAVLTRRGNPASVACALVAGAMTVALMQFGPIHMRGVEGVKPPRFSVGWQMTIGTAVAFVVCIIPSRRISSSSIPVLNSAIRIPRSEIHHGG